MCRCSQHFTIIWKNPTFLESFFVCLCLFSFILPQTVYLICLHSLWNFYSPSLFLDLRMIIFFNSKSEAGQDMVMINNTQSGIKETWIVLLWGYLLRSGHLVHLLFLSIPL